MATLSQLLCRLCDAALDFVIVGGFAEIAYTPVSIARNLEICAALSPSDVAKLREVLRDLNPRHRRERPDASFLLDRSNSAGEVHELHLETDAGSLDVLSSVAGVGGFDRVRLRAVELAPFGRRCRVMALDDLIRAREALGCERDLLVLRQLRAVREKLKQS